ncbi:unnamed protein product [Adineta steineri]|uniref:NHL repeat containing protein n=1 Tax=Adineta steineri TaxID=433720 RepID=A0A815KQQ4_9BILA|nr:unnamed protein product [Adineta steineri]CAF1613479.1 unnamed protein product [Adineta steineri]
MSSFSGIINSYYSIDDIPDNDRIIIINNKQKRNLFKRIILILAISVLCIFMLMIITTTVTITFKKKSINFNYQNSSLTENKIILNISKPLEQNNIASNKTKTILETSTPSKHNNSLNRQLSTNPHYNQNGNIVAGVFSTPNDELNKLQSPASVYLDRERNIYVADTANHRIRKYFPGKSAEGLTLIDKTWNINSPRCLYIDQESNHLFFLDRDNQENYRVQLLKLNSNKLKLTILIIGKQTRSYGMTLDQNLNIYISEFNYHRIVKWLSPNYDRYVIIGENNKKTLSFPRSIYIDEVTNNLYIADRNRIQRWSTNSNESEIVMQGGSLCPNGIEYDSHGNLYISQDKTIKLINNTTDLEGIDIIGIQDYPNMDANFETTANLYTPEGIYLDKTNGDFYVADSDFNRIIKFTIID